MMKVRRTFRLACLAALALSLLGCARGCTSSRPPIHIVPNMDWQPKYQAQEESDFFYDGAAMRTPVPGTVARGRLREDPTFYTGKDAQGEFLTTNPLEATESVLARGADRYSIYCRPCHDKRGNGKGILFERGGVPTPAFSEQRIVALRDGEMFDVVTNSKGLMPAYGPIVPASDRWAIITHVRRLQQEGLVAQARLSGAQP